MRYDEAIEKLHALSGELAPAASGAPRRKFDLDHMRTLAAALGGPQKRFPSVLIAGTNGKGSTAATLASICSAGGYRTGLYTSPHLLRPNERIQISGAGSKLLAEVDDETFAAAFAQAEAVSNELVAKGKLPHAPSYFEVITAMAFLVFADAKVEIAVLEVGLGGRLDATNIVEPVISVITDISLDHMEWLGDTISLIAKEKAGILRPKGTLVTLPQHQEANTAIGEVAMSLGVTGINAASYLPDRISGEGAYPLILRGQEIIVDSPLSGDHQRRNIALAVATAEQLAQTEFPRLLPKVIETGIRLTSWPGRLETATVAGRRFLMDVAHNPAGAWTLRSYLSRVIDGGTLPPPRTLVFSALRDKSIREMAQILFPLFDGPDDRILVAPVQSARAAEVGALVQIAFDLDTSVLACDSVAEAMDRALEGPGSVVVSGSVYLVAEAKAWLKEKNA